MKGIFVEGREEIWLNGREEERNRFKDTKVKYFRGLGETWEIKLHWDMIWSVCACLCVPHHALSVESLWPFYAKEPALTHLFSSPGFISQTAHQAQGVIGCPFSLLMARGEARRDQEANKQNYSHFINKTSTQSLLAFLWSVLLFFTSYFIVLTPCSFLLRLFSVLLLENKKKHHKPLLSNPEFTFQTEIWDRVARSPYNKEPEQ